MTEINSKFDLFWLRQQDLLQLVGENHHTKLDNPTLTKTEINVFQTAFPIYINAKHIEKDWAVELLQKNREHSQFTLTPEFMSVCLELGVNIPFLAITSESYPDSIEKRLNEAWAKLNI